MRRPFAPSTPCCGAWIIWTRCRRALSMHAVHMPCIHATQMLHTCHAHATEMTRTCHAHAAHMPRTPHTPRTCHTRHAHTTHATHASHARHAHPCTSGVPNPLQACLTPVELPCGYPPGAKPPPRQPVHPELEVGGSGLRAGIAAACARDNVTVTLARVKTGRGPCWRFTCTDWAVAGPRGAGPGLCTLATWDGTTPEALNGSPLWTVRAVLGGASPVVRRYVHRSLARGPQVSVADAMQHADYNPEPQIYRATRATL